MCLSTECSSLICLYLELELISLTTLHLVQCRNKELTHPSCRSGGTSRCAINTWHQRIIIPIINRLHLHIAIIVKLLVTIGIEVFNFLNIITFYRHLHSIHTRLARNLYNGCRLLLLTFRFSKVLNCKVGTMPRITITIYTGNIIHRIDTSSHEVNPIASIFNNWLLRFLVSHYDRNVVEIDVEALCCIANCQIETNGLEQL